MSSQYGRHNGHSGQSNSPVWGEASAASKSHGGFRAGEPHSGLFAEQGTDIRQVREDEERLAAARAVKRKYRLRLATWIVSAIGAVLVVAGLMMLLWSGDLFL
ncbi:hypothetical protein SFC07_09495 [Corynebacterium callunae]|uniref:hypothetical protein n=1 Tax=Corynebacterium callunae TaxID=1721 RepID=UPI0039819515